MNADDKLRRNKWFSVCAPPSPPEPATTTSQVIETCKGAIGRGSVHWHHASEMGAGPVDYYCVTRMIASDDPQEACIGRAMATMKPHARNRLRDRLGRWIAANRRALEIREILWAEEWNRRFSSLSEAIHKADAEVKAAGGFAVSHPGWRFGVMA